MSNAAPQSSLRDSVKHVKDIADGVVHVSRAIKDLEKGPLNEKCILILLAHETKMSQKAIKKVLTGLSQLEELYVKPKKERGVDQ